MSSLVLPPHVQKRIDLERRAQYWNALKKNFTIEDPRCQEWTTKLQRINSDLYLVKAKDNVDPEVPLRPGFFHLLVIPRDAPPMVTALTNGDKYAEPGDWIYDALNRGNMGERRVRERLVQQEYERQRDIDRENADRKAARMEKVKDIVNSATRAQISMDRTIPWTQNSSGRRPAK